MSGNSGVFWVLCVVRCKKRVVWFTLAVPSKMTDVCTQVASLLNNAHLVSFILYTGNPVLDGIVKPIAVTTEFNPSQMTTLTVFSLILSTSSSGLGKPPCQSAHLHSPGSS